MSIALCLAKIQDKESMNLTFRVILSLSHVQTLCSSDLGLAITITKKNHVDLGFQRRPKSGQKTKMTV